MSQATARRSPSTITKAYLAPRDLVYVGFADEVEGTFPADWIRNIGDHALHPDAMRITDEGRTLTIVNESGNDVDICATAVRGLFDRARQEGLPSYVEIEIEIPNELHKNLTALAQKRGVSVDELVESVLKDMIREKTGGAAADPCP